MSDIETGGAVMDGRADPALLDELKAVEAELEALGCPYTKASRANLESIGEMDGVRALIRHLEGLDAAAAREREDIAARMNADIARQRTLRETANRLRRRLGREPVEYAKPVKLKAADVVGKPIVIGNAGERGGRIAGARRRLDSAVAAAVKALAEHAALERSVVARTAEAEAA